MMQSPNQTEALSAWLTALEDAGQKLYALLDAAREPNIPQKLAEFGVEAVSLYRGEPEETLADVAPYLVRVAPNSSLLKWFISDGWGKSWGLLVNAPVSLEDLRRHFRRFLLVRDPDGNELYFRFYDPRVLRVYLPTCRAPEAEQFFGRVQSYLVESEDGEAVLEFTRTGLQTIPLSEFSSLPLSGPSSVAAAAPSPQKVSNSRLRIRNDQMKAFSEYMDRSFENRAVLHLREEFPAETGVMTEEQLRTLVQERSNRASQHQLTRETEIGLFLDLTIMFGADFDGTSPWAKETLTNPQLTLEEKVERLSEHRDAELKRRANTR